MNSPAKYLSAEARRAATVEAVIQLAAQTPPSEITTTAIAQHMGVTQGALFKHFPTKEAILEAVMVWVAEHLLSRVDEAAHAAQAHGLMAPTAIQTQAIPAILDGRDLLGCAPTGSASS